MKPRQTKNIELKIESLANSGDGVARHNQKVVFVPFALPGEKVLAQLIEDKKNFARARVIEVLQASPDRREPRCEVFGRCGGCDWQNLEYDKQLFWKQKSLEDVLTRIAKIDDLSMVKKIQPSPLQWHYRNRIQFHCDSQGPFYYGKGSHNKVHFQNCPIACESINQWLDAERSTLPSQGEKIELAEFDSNQVQLFAVSQTEGSELGFRQVNSEQNFFLNKVIVDFVKDKALAKVIDLYCGQGNWSLHLAEQLANVECVGIDNNPTNIKIAQGLAPANCHFLLGDALELLADKKDWADLVVIDPPRAGCSAEVIERLNLNSPAWLVYVSCHPATMARDLKILLNSGWELESVQPVDMFPQTSHLECLTILRSANSLKTANC